MTIIVRAQSDEDIDAARNLMRTFTTWAITLDPDNGDTAPTFAGLEAELAGLPGYFGPPDGCLLIARVADQPAGCVAYRSLGGGIVELKRMYVTPDHRGLGVGRALVAALLDEARSTGVTRVVLDSFHTMTAAHRIYRDSGFRDVAAPPDFPKALAPKVVFMELALA